MQQFEYELYPRWEHYVSFGFYCTCKEHSPGFARLRDLLRSCVRWVERAFAVTVESGVALRCDDPILDRKDTIYFPYLRPRMRLCWRHRNNLNEKVCYSSWVTAEITWTHLPAQISEADVELVLLTGLLLLAGVEIWKLRWLIIWLKATHAVHLLLEDKTRRLHRKKPWPSALKPYAARSEYGNVHCGSTR